MRIYNSVLNYIILHKDAGNIEGIYVYKYEIKRKCRLCVH